MYTEIHTEKNLKEIEWGIFVNSSTTTREDMRSTQEQKKNNSFKDFHSIRIVDDEISKRYFIIQHPFAPKT